MTPQQINDLENLGGKLGGDDRWLIDNAIGYIEHLEKLNEDLHIQLEFYKEREEADWNNKMWRKTDGESYDGKLE